MDMVNHRMLSELFLRSQVGAYSLLVLSGLALPPEVLWVSRTELPTRVFGGCGGMEEMLPKIFQKIEI